MVGQAGHWCNPGAAAAASLGADMPSLWQATLELSKRLQPWVSGTATSQGAAGTLVDANRTETDNYFDGGTLWLPSTNTGSDKGKFFQIRSFTMPGGIFTYTSTNVNPTNDAYTASTDYFPIEILVQAINVGRRWINPEKAENLELRGVTDQIKYPLTNLAGICGGAEGHVIRVEISPDVTDPRRMAQHYNWEEFGGYLYFDQGHLPDGGDVIRLVYKKCPADLSLTSYASEVSPNPCDYEWLIWEAIVECWRWKIRHTRDQEPYMRNHINDALTQVAIWRAKNAWGNLRDPHFGWW